MKTILIPIYQAIEVKNILRTDIINKLFEQTDVRVICLARYQERIGYYEKEIPYKQIIYDFFYDTPRGFIERMFSLLKFYTIRTSTTNFKRRAYYEINGGFFHYVLGRAINYLLARKMARMVLRFLDFHLVGDSGYGKLLDRYKPDVVLLAHLFDDAEISLLRQARKRHTQTVGFVNSWDKLTARSAIRILPDTLIVYNELTKQDAINHADMPEEQIRVCGIPQYDIYKNRKPRSRREFFREIGLDPGRPLILYAPFGETLSGSDWEMIDLFHSLVKAGAFVKSAQLFVRFQPNDFITESELASRPWMKYDRPGVRYGSERGGDWDMTFADIEHLHDTFAHISILVCHASSLSIDAVVMGKPVINIGFEIKPIVNPMKSPTRFYVMEHYRKALATGGIRLVKNKDELVTWINRYLEEPGRDALLREALARQQWPHADGKSGARIASVVFEAIDRNKAIRRNPYSKLV